MFRQHTVSTRATSMLMLLSVVGLGAARVQVCGGHRSSPERRDCARSRSCCCESGFVQSACRCQSKQDSPPVSPVAAGDPERSGKLLPWIAATQSVREAVLLAAAAHITPSGGVLFSTPRQLQTLYCIWRV